MARTRPIHETFIPKSRSSASASLGAQRLDLKAQIGAPGRGYNHRQIAPTRLETQGRRRRIEDPAKAIAGADLIILATPVRNIPVLAADCFDLNGTISLMWAAPKRSCPTGRNSFQGGMLSVAIPSPVPSIPMNRRSLIVSRPLRIFTPTCPVPRVQGRAKTRMLVRALAPARRLVAARTRRDTRGDQPSVAPAGLFPDACRHGIQETGSYACGRRPDATWSLRAPRRCGRISAR